MADRCKFEKYQYQLSYDSGSTWQDVTPIQVRKGDVIEYMSSDCGQIDTIYKWVDLEGTYICDGNNKYTRQIQEESYDNGVSWYASYPTVYREGTFVGVDADFCADKFVGHYVYVDPSLNCGEGYYWDGVKCVKRSTPSGGGTQGDVNNPMRGRDPLKVVKCNDSTTLTSAETQYYNSGYTLISAEIGDCVTAVGKGAFSGCTILESVNIPSGITSIGEWGFKGCRSLSSITIPNGVTSIDSSAFYGCSSLTSVNIPSGVRTINPSTFRECRSLTSIEIPSGVTSIVYAAFYGCSGLTSIDIPSGVTSIGAAAFYNCSALTSITIRRTSPPTLGANAFDNTNNCPIYVPCSGVMTYISSSDWEKYKSRIYGIPPCEDEPIKFKATYSNGNEYEVRCNSTSAITTADTKPSGYSYTAMTSALVGECTERISESAFTNCRSLSSVTFQGGLDSIAWYAFKNCTSLKAIVLPSGLDKIGDETFYNCSSLTSCTIPDGVQYIGLRAFEYCSSLTSVNIPSSVMRISGGAFSDCTSLTNIDIPNATSIIEGGAFANCRSLTSVTIGSGVTSIGYHAFYGCSGLTSFTINATTPPALDLDVLGNTNNCPIYVPCESIGIYKTDTNWKSFKNRIQGIPPCVPLVKFYAETSQGATKLAECDNNLELTTAETKTDINYREITSCTIGDCVTTIGVNAFTDYWDITSIGQTGSGASVEIPSGVTTISNSAFTYCTGVTSINIPITVTSIGGSAFKYCNSLTSITIEATTPPTLGGSAFDNTNDCPIYVPCLSLDTYKAANVWELYVTRLFGIPPCEPPIFDGKFKAVYRNGQIYTKSCDSDTYISTTTTRPSGYQFTAMTSAEIGDCANRITDKAFSGCTSLSSITIPNSVTEFDTAAFYGCSALTSVEIPSAVTYISSNVFQNCSGLTSIDIPSGVTFIGAVAFENCRSLTSITIEATTPPTLGTRAFNNTNNCPIYVPSASVSTYKSASGWSDYASRIYAIT